MKQIHSRKNRAIALYRFFHAGSMIAVLSESQDTPPFISTGTDKKRSPPR